MHRDQVVPGYSYAAACRHSPAINYQIQLPLMVVIIDSEAS